MTDAIYNRLTPSGNPAAPIQGEVVYWQSDGVGHGDTNDIMWAINDGSATNYGTLIDFSAGSPF